MKLFSIQRFKLIGSSVQHDAPELLDRVYHAEYDSLKEGESTVVSEESNGVLIARGYRVTRLPDYNGLNQVYFDSEAKEHVLVTNGKCVLDHSSPEAFQASHNGHECEYAPSEAIVLRVVTHSDGSVSIAWTYRAVNPCNLQATIDAAATKQSFQAILQRRRSKKFLGRV